MTTTDDQVEQVDVGVVVEAGDGLLDAGRADAHEVHGRSPRIGGEEKHRAHSTALVAHRRVRRRVDLDRAHKVCKRVSMPSLYEHAGGEEALHRLEQAFYDSVLTDPLLQPLFGAGQPQHVDHLTAFTAETFGGPDRFTRELGFAHLIDVHRGLKITDGQRRRFIELYLAALDAVGMPDDAPFREAVREHVEFGTAVAQQNSHATTDAELHPLREVPHWTWAGDG